MISDLIRQDRVTRKWTAVLLLSILVCSIPTQIQSQIQRFPKPEFESGHVVPTPTTPHPRQDVFEYIDVAVLIIALSTASYLALKKRSRNGIFLLSLFSLLYFGFWRKGCVCAIGSIQNVSLALFDQTYVIPVTVIAFFTIPLLFTLFFGRTFCAAVCPLGAIQDVVILKPLKIPLWLQKVLGFIPHIYLGLAVLLATYGADFIICRYDPFVGLFRFDASFPMLLFGAVLLIGGIFVARPYCRFLCPYGLILNWISRLSKHHVTITPTDCIQCRLCEDSCPFGAILPPTPEKAPEARSVEHKRLAILLALLPVLVIGGAYLGFRLHTPLSQIHNTVQLAERVRLEELGKVQDTVLQSETFQESGKPVEQLYSEAALIKNRFKKGSTYSGGFIGLMFGMTLIGLSIRRKRRDYIPDRATCISCGRCFAYCPVGKKESKKDEK